MIDVNTCLIISRVTAQLPACKYRMKTLGKTPKITLGMSAGHNLGHNLQYVRNLKDLFKSWCTSCVYSRTVFWCTASPVYGYSS